MTSDHKIETTNGTAYYWSFFWPLALMGAANLLANQFQNATLARYPNAVQELATFAIAASIFAINKSFVAFVPQMANVFNRSIHGGRVCFRFVIGMSLMLAVPTAFLGFTAPGGAIVTGLFGLDPTAAANVALYLKIVTPVILIEGARFYFVGLLVQAHRTFTVTVLNITYLAVTGATLVLGFQLEWAPVVTVGVSQLAAASCHWVLVLIMVSRLYHLPERQEHGNLTYREAIQFFWPLALNSVMFAFTRPVIYAFVSRTPEPENTIAALRVAFEFTMIFFNPLNQFRHLYVTFGREDPKGVKQFMILIMLLILALMLTIVFTPLGSFFFGTLLGVPAEVERLALQTTFVLCIVPLAMTLRNYFHGLSLIHRQTGRMGFSGVIRIICLVALSWVAFQNGWLDNKTAAAVLASGYLIEALTVMVYNRYRPAGK